MRNTDILVEWVIVVGITAFLFFLSYLLYEDDGVGAWFWHGILGHHRFEIERIIRVDKSGRCVAKCSVCEKNFLISKKKVTELPNVSLEDMDEILQERKEKTW